MTKLPLSPRLKFARTVLICAYFCACIIALIFAVRGKNWPSDEQMSNAPSGEYQR